MTSLKFVGDLPLWWGLALSLLVCLMSWRYYSRESFDLPRHMKWLLPLLRSTAFFLGVMMLTSPVLHHRKTVGELGKVQIFLDQSKSMSLNDTHLPTAEKLNIAKELGWLSNEEINLSLADAAARLGEVQEQFDEQLSALDSTMHANDGEQLNAEQISRLENAVNQFRQQLVLTQKELPGSQSTLLKSKIIDKLPTLSDQRKLTFQDVDRFEKIAADTDRFRLNLLEEFKKSLALDEDSGTGSPLAAVTQFDVTSRWRRAEIGIAESPANILEELRKFHDVEVFSLRGENAPILQLQKDKAESIGSEETIYFSQTNLTAGIFSQQKNDGEDSEDKTQEVSEQAIVLISDGNHNSGSSPLQMAKVLGQQNVKIYPIAMGAETSAADIAVIGVEAPDTVFKTDSIRGALLLKDAMPAGQPFIAQIKYEDRTLWQEELVSQNIGEREIEFEFTVKELIEEQSQLQAGDVEQFVKQLKLTAGVVPLQSETETENNFRHVHIGVIADSHRILILDGRSRWETRYLRNVFERDEQWQVTTILAGIGTEEAELPRGDQPDQFPASRDDLFEYDLIIFGEISRDLFREQELLWIKEFVDLRGGGLIFVDGQRQMIRTYLDSKIETLIPIEWTDQTLTQLPQQLQLTDKGATEPALRLLVDKQQNQEFWTKLPAPHTMTPVAALTGAEVLAEVQVGMTTYPAMVTRRVGSGRVLFLAFDETWRWRYKAADLWHQRAWNQIARYVIPRPFAVSDEFVAIDTGQVRYSDGESVNIRARLIGVDGKPVASTTAEALLWRDGQVVGNVHLVADKEVPGLYRGTSTSLTAGEYEASVRASGFSASALKARSRFIVQAEEDNEMATTAANHALLQQMAEASGGMFLREYEISRLPELLSPLSRGRVIESETVLWQSYWWFVLMIALLTAEWILRKRVGLL